MIGLKISGQQVEVNPETRIDFKLVNPLFNDDTLSPGSYTLPFDLPGGEVSPINASIFKNIDVIENQEKFTRQEAKLFFDGVYYKKGKIKAKTVSSRILSTNFIFGLSTISDEIKTKKIRELLDEEIVIDDSEIEKKVILKPGAAAQSDELPFPFDGQYKWTLAPIVINGKSYEVTNTIIAVDEQELLEDLAALINADTDSPRAVATVITAGASSGGFAAPYMEIQSFDAPNDPHAELQVSLDGMNSSYLFDPSDFSYEFRGYKWQVHTEMGNADLDGYYDPFWTALQGYFTGVYPDDKLRFPAMFNGGGLGKQYFYNMLAPDGTLKRNIPCSTNFFYGVNTNSIHPFVRLHYLLDSIATYFGFEWEGDFFTSADTAEMLIWNPNNLDMPMDFIGNTKQFTFWQRSFNVKDLVPDISVTELLQSLASRYNLAIYPNEQTGKVRIVYREPLAKSTVFSDITSQCGRPEPIEDNSISGIKLTARKESKDTLAGDDVYDIGDPEVTLPSAASSIRRSENFPFGDVGNISGPRVYHPPDDKFELRIFYYKGIVDNGTIEYPQAGINAISYTDAFDGVDGLYVNFWKRWLEYQLRRRSVPIDIDFTFADLKNFAWELKRRFDRNNYLVKSLDFTMESNRITVCKAVLYTMV